MTHIKIKQELTHKENYRFIVSSVFRNKLMKRMFLITSLPFILIVIISILLSLLYGEFNLKIEYFWTLWFPGFMAFFLFLFPAIVLLFSKRETNFFEFTDDGMKVTGRLKTSTYSWGDFIQYKELKNYFLIPIAGRSMALYVIPKRAFSDLSEMDEFVLLLERVGLKKK